MIHRIRTIDAHAAGEPLRLVIEGMPAPEGRTMLEKRAWAQKRLDHLRKALILEPRGHTDMYGALLTEPVSRDAHAGMLFMHNEGWSTMCGHGIIAVTTMAIERGLICVARERVPPPNGVKPVDDARFATTRRPDRCRRARTSRITATRCAWSRSRFATSRRSSSSRR